MLMLPVTRLYILILMYVQVQVYTYIYTANPKICTVHTFIYFSEYT